MCVSTPPLPTAHAPPCLTSLPSDSRSCPPRSPLLNARPIGISIRSRNAALSRKGCAVNGQMTMANSKRVPRPPPLLLLPCCLFLGAAGLAAQNGCGRREQQGCSCHDRCPRANGDPGRGDAGRSGGRTLKRLAFRVCMCCVQYLCTVARTVWFVNLVRSRYVHICLRVRVFKRKRPWLCVFACLFVRPILNLSPPLSTLLRLNYRRKRIRTIGGECVSYGN